MQNKMEQESPIVMQSPKFCVPIRLPLIAVALLLLALPSQANIYDDYFEKLNVYFDKLQEFYLIIRNHYEGGSRKTPQTVAPEKHHTKPPVHVVTDSNEEHTTTEAKVEHVETTKTPMKSETTATHPTHHQTQVVTEAIQIHTTGSEDGVEEMLQF